MKTYLKYFIIGLVSSCLIGDVYKASATLEVGASFQISATADFYTPLAAEGAWVEVGSYGRCWRPAHVAVGWRPYCDGHWMWTDCGWYWASDEPWAWACYHYGRWVYESDYGWVWIPGVEWAPAWVSWRVGGGYIGWAPLAPAGFHFRARIGFPTPFVFVETHRFSDHVRPSTVIVNNTTIINHTKVIENTRHETRTFEGGRRQKVVVNEGPGLKVVQKASAKPIKQVTIHEAVRETPAPHMKPHDTRGPSASPKAEHGSKSVEPAGPAMHPAKPSAPPEEHHGKPDKVAPSVPDHPAPAPAPAPDQKHAPGKSKPGKDHGDHGHGHGHGPH